MIQSIKKMIDPFFHPKLHLFPVFMGHQYKSQVHKEYLSSLGENCRIPRNQQQNLADAFFSALEDGKLRI